MGGGGGVGGSHCKWCANEITSYSKNNVIFSVNKQFPFPPLCNLLLKFLFLLTVLHPSPYSPFWESLFLSLNKGEEIRGLNYG